MRPPIPLGELSEKDWQKQVVELAQTLGWRKAYHTYDSRRSSSGFPDLVLVRDKVIYLELKTETGKVSDAQLDWLAALQDAGAYAYIARPRHLEDISRLLSQRGHFPADLHLHLRELLELRKQAA